jgi:hypothetical protein
VTAINNVEDPRQIFLLEKAQFLIVVGRYVNGEVLIVRPVYPAFP